MMFIQDAHRLSDAHPGCGCTGAAFTAAATTTMRRRRRAFNELHLRHTLHRSCIFGLRRRRKAAGTVADCYASALRKLVQLYRAREESSCIYFFAIHGTTVQLGKDLGQAWGWIGAWTPNVLNSTFHLFWTRLHHARSQIPT